MNNNHVVVMLAGLLGVTELGLNDMFSCHVCHVG